MKSLSIEDYLRKESEGEGFSEFKLAIFNKNPLTIYIYPLNKDGETYDAYVNGFELLPYDKLNERLEQIKESNVLKDNGSSV